MGFSKPNSNRILCIAPQPFYADRGTPIAVRHVINAFTESGAKVDLLTYPIGEDIDLPGLRIYRIPNLIRTKKIPIGFSARKVFMDAILIPAIWNRLSRESYSFIHAIEEAAFPAVIAGRWKNVPVVYDMQSSLPEQLMSYPLFRSSVVQKGLRRCERWLLQKANLVACSAGLENYVRDVSPSTPVMEWYFPGQHVHVGPEEVKRLREDLRIEPDSQVVLYTGSFEAYQELHRLIEASRKTVGCLPKTVFVLVGINDSEKLAVSAESKDLLKRGSLRLLPRKPRSEIPKFLAMAQVLVSPRENVQNLPLKIFDYLAAGRPIVAFDCPTTRTVLNDDRAVMVDPSANDLGEAITLLLQNPERAKRLGEAARTYAEQRLGWKTFVDLVSEVQGRALRNGRKSKSPVVHSTPV